jgi:hypothetical protein
VEVDEDCLVLTAGEGQMLVLLRAKLVKGDFDCFAAAVQRRVMEGSTFDR